MLSSSKWKCGSEKDTSNNYGFSWNNKKSQKKPETFINAPGRCVVLL